MDDCKHPRVQTWTFEGAPAGMWSCVECGHKFVPLDLAQEKDAERYRWLRNNPQWLGWEHDFRPDEVEREIDAAMDGQG